MSNLEKLRSTFLRHGHKPASKLRRAEFENFLNSIVVGLALCRKEICSHQRCRLRSGSRQLKARIK